MIYSYNLFFILINWTLKFIGLSQVLNLFISHLTHWVNSFTWSKGKCVRNVAQILYVKTTDMGWAENGFWMCV